MRDESGSVGTAGRREGHAGDANRRPLCDPAIVDRRHVARGDPVRRDDNPEVFKTRLEVYREQTAPVTEYYRSQGLLNTVDGLQPIDAVTEQLTEALTALPSLEIRSDVR